jgi:hypothetical protein
MPKLVTSLALTVLLAAAAALVASDRFGRFAGAAPASLSVGDTVRYVGPGENFPSEWTVTKVQNNGRGLFLRNQAGDELFVSPEELSR